MTCNIFSITPSCAVAPTSQGGRFNGVDTQITVPYYNNNGGVKSFTIALWFKANNVNFDQGLVYWGNDASSGCYPGSIDIRLTPGGQVCATVVTISSGTTTYCHWFWVSRIT